MNAAKLDKAKASKPFRLADILLYAVVIALTAAVVLWSYSRPGRTVIVRVDGQTFEYALNENRRIDAGALTVVIQDGEVWIEDADCPDHVCEHTGRISHANQTIVCIPNKIVVYLSDKSDSSVVTGQR